ncbi:hypothetical protein L1987_38050 [Smallanthus sonchifolius]|uniref:Uncharacterized protein n=2 Tax=Smallanthus sonchifolius TaxID=185202 RepID=A0ACB9HHL4_9ASTR|nr:hypothetical protein L1987_38050 [Smallanthus sonchifolius]
MGKGIFFTSASMLLAILITATLRHHHHHHPTNSPPTHYPSNASKLLRSNGFNLMANFLHISPELLHSTPQTIFAIPDAAFANLSIPPYMIKHLLAYHISPTKLTTQDLLNKPLKTCLPTLIHHQTLSITKIANKKQVLEINNVLITHPDLFLQQSVTIHGVAGSFAWYDHRQERITLPYCKPDRDELGFIKNKEEWGRVIKFLSSSGFMSFAIGLNSVTDGIVKEYPDLDSVTIFTPPNVALMAMSSSPLLDKFMRFHMVVQRHSFKQLAGLPPGASLSTLVRGKHVDITENSRVSQVMSINGVAITAPDLFVSKNFVVHGIARALNMDELSSMSR